MKNVGVAITGLVIALAFTLGACGGDGVVGKYSKLVDEMCKCKDKACSDKMRTKRRDLQKSVSKPSKSEMEKIGKLDKKWRECRKSIEKKDDKTAPAVKTKTTDDAKKDEKK